MDGGVSKWPMLANLVLPPDLRSAIEDEAARNYISMSELMRGILCDHYNLRCETVHAFGGQKPSYAKTFSLRVSPELFNALQREKKASGAPMRRLVLEILNEHYVTEVTPA